MVKSLGVFAAICLCVTTGVLFADDDVVKSEGKSEKTVAKKGRAESTHKQARVLTPKHNAEKITLNTFCLAPSGDVLMCVGGPSVEYVPKPNDPSQYEIKHIASKAFVQKYSADGELIAEFPVEFKPTGINMMPDGKEFVVAGGGWLARMTLDGELVKKGRTPQVGDFEKFKSNAIEAAKADIQLQVQTTKQMLEQAEKQIAKLEETPEDERSKDVKAQIEAQKSNCKAFESQISQIENMFGYGSPEDMVNSRLTVTGVAVTDKDIFVSVRKLKGHGYDVWRTNHDFEEGEKVVTDLGGCCGQLDIQASEGKLLVAENGKFRVGIYDRDGEMASSFGKRDRKAEEGFGSCCNPMNVRCCANGDILTAESSIGDIKRFSSDGKFVGYVGRAKIGGGCKHVAIEFDATRNRYYMQHQDKGHICVLVPLSEITGPSEDELLEQAAREGQGKKIVGTWTIPSQKKSKKGGILGLLNAFGGEQSNSPGDQLTFEEDGQLKIIGGQLGGFQSGNSLEWRPVQQNGAQLDIAIQIEGVDTYNFRVNFESDDTAKIDLRYEENAMGTANYQRKGSAKPEAAKGDSASSN